MLAYEAKYNKSLEDCIDLTIYDKNEDVGGTWLVNQYPGVAVSDRTQLQQRLPI
jgi:cation diffusion facilitator CzcD-associated flavoprotein CzcO